MSWTSQAAWEQTEDGRWVHRPWWKVAVNTVLRALQPGVRFKWVVYTRCASGCAEPPPVLGYGFGRVEHRR